MEMKMDIGRKAFQIRDVVIERVAVLVVDVMTRRNGAMRCLPNFLMERTHSSTPMVR